MGTLNNKSSFDCLKKLEANPDMPYFLLLASDVLAPAVVRRWTKLAAEAGVNPAKVAEAERVAYDMERYQDRKVPD